MIINEPIHYKTTINSADMKKSKHYDIGNDMRYLQLLSNSFPTIAEASTEIINLQAILNLPKATEHFIADIHGEYEAFQHCAKPRRVSFVRSFIIPSKSWSL